MTIVYVFGLLPILDLVLEHDVQQPKNEDSLVFNKSFKYPIYIWVVFYILSFIVTLFYVNYRCFDLFKTLLISFSFGLISSQSIAVAHELSHKNNYLDRTLSKIILSGSIYNHFYTEHKYGHHVNVATPLDPATAKRNQNVYNFVLQSILGGIKNSWKIEFNQQGYNNYILKSWVCNLGFGLFLYQVNSFLLFFYISQALVSIFILESINYIEHYGLIRKKIGKNYESVSNKHSWDSNNMITNCLLFRIGRHSDHHTHSTKEYQSLVVNVDSPKLPFGYMGSLLLVLFPSLWFKTMNPLLDKIDQKN
jgi:alkane 1-monooxygenase